MTTKIIGGKRYSTAEARLIAGYDNGLSASDFKHFEEELYVTEKGNWFTCGSGGPLSPYAVSTGNNSWAGSSDVIRTMTPYEARAWLERYGETEALEAYFADTIEDA